MDTSSIFENINVSIPSNVSVEFAVGAKGPTHGAIRVREHIEVEIVFKSIDSCVWNVKKARSTRDRAHACACALVCARAGGLNSGEL